MGSLILVGGKGGVGKTTTACATACWFAKGGLRTLIVSSDPAHSTSDALGFSLGHTPTQVEGVPFLWGMELDPQAHLETLLPRISDSLGGGMVPNMSTILGSDAAEEVIDGASSIKAGELMLPGLDEALAFDQLIRHLEDPRFDVIVFDTAPTGHTLRLLALPELLDQWTGRILKILRMQGGLRSLLFGRKQQDEMQEELERLSRRIAHVRRVLADKDHARFLLVTIAEQMAVDETIRAAEGLAEFGINIGGVVVNRLTPDLDFDWLQGRRSIEQRHLENLKRYFEGLSLAEVPLEATDVHGIEALEALGTSIHGDEIDEVEHDGPQVVGKQIEMTVRKGLILKTDAEGATRVRMYLPGARKEEIGLKGRDSHLLVSVNGHEAAIDIGREFDITGLKATFKESILSLTLPPSLNPPLDSEEE